MKKRLLSVALLMGTMAANAQVGIGTATPHRSAELLIESNNRGLLIPNVALTTTKDKTTITNGNVQSLLVYATKAQGDITPGYYYWDISVWRRLTADADIPAIVVNQFENILKLEGDKVTNLIKNLIKANETLTVLGYDKTTGTLTYTDEAGKAITVDVKGAVKSFETVTSITTDAAKGTITFKDEAGKDTVLDIKALVKANETITTLVREEAGKYTYTNEAGTESKITVIGDITEVIKGKTDLDLYNVLKQLVNVEQTLTQLVYNTTDRQLAYTDEKNATHNIDVDALVKENQTVTTLNSGTNIKVTEVKGANSISYTLDVPTASKDVAGVVKPSSGLEIDKDGNLTVNLETALNGKNLTGNDIIVVTDGKGAVLRTTALSVNEKAIKLENLGGTLNLSQLQTGNAGYVLVVDATGNVVWSAKDAVTSNSLVLKGTELTSTVNGVGSTQTLKDKLTTEMLVNGSVTVEKLGAGKGNEGKVPVAQADGTVVYQNVSSDNVDGKALTSANNLLTVSNTAGVVLKDVVLTIDQTKFELNQIGGILQLTQIEKGGADTVLVTEVGVDGKPVVKWVTKESVVTSNETVTSIVDHGNGTFTYTDEKNVPVTFDANTVKVEVKEGVYTFKDGKGTTITTIDTNAIASGYDNGTSGLKAENVQAAIDELVKKINEVANTKGTLSSTDITITEGKDALLKDVTLAIAEGAVTTEKIAPGAVTTEKIKAGGADTVLVTEKDGTVKWVTKDSLVKLNETVTQLVLNKNGTFTYYNESEIGADGTPKADATGVVIDPSLVNVTKDGNSYVFTNAKGDKIATITFEATDITYNDTTNLGATNVQEAIQKLLTKINTVEAHKADLSTDGIILVNDGKILAGSVLEAATLSIKDGSITSDKIKGGKEGDVLVTEKDGTVKWVTKAAATSNTLTKKDGTNGNTIVSTVNGVPAEIALVDKVENKVDGTTITTVVNGVESASVDLTSAIEAGQKTTSVTKGSDKVTVVTTGAGTKDKNTEYTVDVNEAKLSLQNIGGQVTNNQIKGGKEGDVLVSTTDAEGNPITKWVTKKDATTNKLEVVGNELVSTVNDVEGKTDLTQAITTPMLKDGAVTADKLNAGTGVADRVAVADAAGNVTYKTQKEVVEGNSSNELKLDGNKLTSTVNGKPSTVTLTDVSIVSSKGITGTGITVEGGANATLKDVTLAVTPGTAGQVMVTSKDGLTTTWVNQNDIVKNNTTNVLKSEGNTLTSTVNDKESNEVKLVNSIGNTIVDNKLVTTVNGVSGDGLDLTPAIQAGQLKTTVSAEDKKVTVVGTLDTATKTTNYVVGVVEKELNLGEMGGQVTTTQIKAGKDGEVLVTIKDGASKEITKWVPQKDVVTKNTTNDLKIVDGKLVSTVNDQPATADLTNQVTKDMLQAGSVTKEKIAADVAGEGLVKNTTTGALDVNAGNGIKIVDDKVTVNAGTGLSFDKDGKLTVNYETAKTTLATGDVTSKSITVTGGDKSTFKNVELEITAGANKGDVLVTGDNGKVEWVTKKDATSNVLKSEGNTLTSTVNGKDSNAVSIVNSVGNTLNDKNELVTIVNGVSSTTAIDLTPAIQAGQKTTVVAKGTGVTVTPKTEGKVTTYTVSADSSTITLDGDVTGTADNTTISKLQGKELVTTNVAEGNVLVFDGAKWVAKTPTVDASNVENGKSIKTDNIILVNGGKELVKSVLADTKLSIANNAITADKLKGGDNNQVLTTVGTGKDAKVEWKTPTVNTTDITEKGNLTSTTENLLTVKDGNGAVLQNVSLTVNQDKFELNKIGGTLSVTKVEAGKPNQVLVTEGDKVTWVDNKTFVQANQEKVVVKPADGKTNNSNVIVTPTTGTNGEKEYTVDVKAAMPKVFYMPPVMFDTSKQGTGKTRNLYNEYVAMFGGIGKVEDTPITGTRPALVKSDASATIPVYAQGDLNFFIPYYDPTVFTNVKVDKDGVLTYDIIKKAKYGAFMTVVFVVK